MTTKDVDEREATLPKWARALLANLRTRLNDERVMRERTHGKPSPDSAVVIHPYSDEFAMGFAHDTCVAFRVSENASSVPGMDGWVTVSIRDGSLDVSVCGGRLAILPTASNCALLREAGRS